MNLPPANAAEENKKMTQVPIIYENAAMVAVNKPAGLSVHADGKTSAETLVDWIVQKYPDSETVGEPLTLSDGSVIHRAGIVHRLDKDTSGVLLVAKNQEMFEYLKKQFQERLVEKEYRAIVHGHIAEKKGVIETPIGRDIKNFKIRAVGFRARGALREARTEYAVLGASALFSYLSVRPKTGRTHQIRVHLKSIGHPIVCDPLYAPRRACPFEMGRLALHARTITIRMPEGATLLLEAPIPDDFERAIKTLRLDI